MDLTSNLNKIKNQVKKIVVRKAKKRFGIKLENKNGKW